ncbi:CapA family protein [Bdellovibrio sp. NC01]|uniref:CapA family protein n=1 Tax=Bdellovibrio sp. NC01 TaxID=2220073 RepID=UPI00115A3CBB|nr:CapA family protein [Bdellovibrio sp. NC01]QDK36695.1 CapA family protein [Bdellovibrio sp. NC01]
MKHGQFLFALLLAPLWASADSSSKDISFSTKCDTRNDIATVSFVGDVLIHKPLYEIVVNDTKKFSQIWKRTNPLIQKADLSLANLEGPAAMGIDRKGRDHGDIGFVYDGEVYSGTNMLFNYHPQILKDLKDSGYDLLTVANNHSLDRGSMGIDKTLQAARAIGLPTVGTRLSSERNADFYQIAKVKGLNVAVVGCTEMTNGSFDSKDQILNCYKDGRAVQIVKDLAARSDVDAVIVFPHWGQEYQPLPDSSQVVFAHRFLEAGAVAVVGSHPHVVQPWEKYVTQDGRETLVVYSLGNFVAAQKDVERKTGPIVYLGLSKEGSQKAKVFGVAYTPTFRVSAELFPVGKDGNKDVLAYAAKNFGTVNRLEPSSNLLEKICK